MVGEEGSRRGRKEKGLGGGRMDGDDGDVRVREEDRDFGGCDAYGRDRASCRGDRSREMSEGLDRRTILEEVGGRY